MKTILKMLVAIIVAAFMAGVLIVADASDNAVIVTYFCTALMLCALFGVFDEKKKCKESKHESIRHYDGRKNYGQAAVFMGTACLFIGTPKQCEDMCDDLWHWGQQAHMETIDGSESSFEIL